MKAKDRIFWYKKTVLYGAGHPQLLSFFGVRGSKKNVDEFWENHETTHARFDSVDGRTLSEETKKYAHVYEC
jgi:hypothetical protein